MFHGWVCHIRAGLSPILLFGDCETLGQLFNFLVPQSPHLRNGHESGIFHMGNVGKRMREHVKACAPVTDDASRACSRSPVSQSTTSPGPWRGSSPACNVVWPSHPFPVQTTALPARVKHLELQTLFFALLTYSWLHPIFWPFLPSTLLGSWKAVKSQLFSLYAITYYHSSPIIHRHKFMVIDDHPFPKVFGIEGCQRIDCMRRWKVPFIIFQVSSLKMVQGWAGRWEAGWEAGWSRTS